MAGMPGIYAFCRQCSEYETCTHEFAKVHPVSIYVYRYLQDIEAGFKIYPQPGSWENQQDWFIYLLNSAQAELESLRQAESRKNGKQ